MTERELRDEFEEWANKVNVSKYNEVYFVIFKSGYMIAQETIKAKDAEIEYLIKEAKKELSEKDKTIAHLSSECTRLFEPTRKFWNGEKDKAIAEARELINVALKITEERSFWIKDEFIMESEQVEEWREKAKAWLEANK